ncbi:hypothetical protein TNCV_3833711 [Trichonephila clavipes]|nr:hypothetical protein TNCV_3833711 [Trichonephila clavipes]
MFPKELHQLKYEATVHHKVQFALVKRHKKENVQLAVVDHQRCHRIQAHYYAKIRRVWGGMEGCQSLRRVGLLDIRLPCAVALSTIQVTVRFLDRSLSILEEEDLGGGVRGLSPLFSFHQLHESTIGSTAT